VVTSQGYRRSAARMSWRQSPQTTCQLMRAALRRLEMRADYMRCPGKIPYLNPLNEILSGEFCGLFDQ